MDTRLPPVRSSYPDKEPKPAKVSKKKKRKPRKTGGPKPDRKQMILSTYVPGMSAADVAKIVVCSPTWVNLVLSRAGISLLADKARVKAEGAQAVLDAVKEKKQARATTLAGAVEQVRAERATEAGVEGVLPDKASLALLGYMERWALSMESFVEEALGINGAGGYRMSSQQREACREISRLVRAKEAAHFGLLMNDEDREYAEKVGISIMAGQGPGKDAWCAWFMLWFLTCFQNVLIPCTAPGSDQLKNILWAEVSRWLFRRDDKGEFLVVPLVRENIAVQGDKIFVKEFGGKKNFAFPKTANPKDDPEAQAKTLYGYHDDHMAIIIDEASGVLDPVFKPLEGTLTGMCNFLVMVFNPVKRTGFAIESQIGSFSHKWIKLRWSAEDSENVNPQHIKDMEEKYGRDSNTFRTLVLGLPPTADADTLIPYDWVIDAVGRGIEPDEEDAWIGGLDPGAGGDNSVFIVRHGRKMEAIEQFSSPDTMAVANWAAGIFDKFMLDIMFVDSIGIGNGVYNRLRELGYRVRSVDVRRKARDEERFDNVRAELWWKAREIFEEGAISILDNQFLKEELWSPKFEIKGRKIMIEDKRAMRKHLGSSRSPNHADALLLTFHDNDSIYRKKVYDRGEKPSRRVQPEPTGWMAA